MREFIVALATLILSLAPMTHAAGGSGTSSTWAVSGGATWYDWRPGEAAAGPLLRRQLGSSWRGSLVRVSANGRAVVVRLTDWCACGPRHGVPTLIDLDVRSFARLASPSTGVLRVVAAPVKVPAPPETSTEP